MKKLVMFLLCVFAVCASACSSVDGESIDTSQEALACNYPKGSVGSTKLPSTGVIRQFVAQTQGSDLAQGGYYNFNTGLTTTEIFDWWPMANVAMSGGWAGTLLTTVSFACGPSMLCMRFNGGQPDEGQLVFGNGGAGMPFGSTVTMNQGVTKIHMGYNDTGNYRAMIFTGWHNGEQVVIKRTIPGTNGC